MNLRRLQYFVKIVDVGSLTQAADILHVAQPALEPAARDAGGRGAPATAGADQARRDADRGGQGALPPRAADPAPVRAGAGRHEGGRARACRARCRSGLAPGTAAADLARAAAAHRARRAIPGIVLYLNETYGTTLSELIMNGRMDLAVLYGGTTAVHGLVVPAAAARAALPRRAAGDAGAGRDRAAQATSCDMELFLPRPYNVVRKMVDDACAGIGHRAARRGRDRIGRHPHRGDRRGPRRDDPAGVDGARGGRGLPRPGSRGSSSRRSRRRWRSASPTTCRCRSRRRR